MAELTKKLHYQKTGSTDIEDITLYDSTEDCEEPYLSLQVDGANVYAKLGDSSDDNATALKVYKNSDKTTYSVLKENITLLGSITYDLMNDMDDKGICKYTFTVPRGISIIKIESNDSRYEYAALKTENSYIFTFYFEGKGEYLLKITDENGNRISDSNFDADIFDYAILSWSPEINQQTPTIKDNT